MKKEYSYIDFLKVIGLFCIILAHVNPPSIIMQLRNFDVPLMVVLSGFLVFNNNYTCNGGGYNYLKKRLTRLVIPVWIFLCLYFSALYVATGNFDIKLVIKSFCFQQDSIGYVWIIWVYVIVAMMTFPMLKLYDRYGKFFVLIYMFIYFLYELAVLLGIGLTSRFFIYTIYYAVPYGLISLFGLLYSTLSWKRKILVAVGFILIFAFLAIFFSFRKGAFVPTQDFKYPPRIYWISYAVGVSYLLMLVCEHLEPCFLFDNFVIRFIGRNTLWIYLWHIPFILISLHITDKWFIRFLIVALGAVSIDFFQLKVVGTIENSFEKIKNITKFLHG